MIKEINERQRLEREVIDKARVWNATNYRDELAAEKALTELGDAVDGLEKFVAEQKRIEWDAGPIETKE